MGLPFPELAVLPPPPTAAARCRHHPLSSRSLQPQKIPKTEHIEVTTGISANLLHAQPQKNIISAQSPAALHIPCKTPFLHGS